MTSCTVGEKTLIGQGAVIGQGADIGGNVIIAAGSVVLPDTVVPNRQLWAGNPAQYVRDVTDEEVEAATVVRTCLFVRLIVSLMFCLSMYVEC